MQIVCYTISSTLDYVGKCENATSILWVRRFYQGDEFKLRIPATKENIRLFAKGNAIEVVPDYSMEKSYFCGIITSITMSHTVSGAQITVNGMSPDGFLERRIIQKYSKGRSFMGVISDNAGDDADVTRQFPATKILTSPNFNGVEVMLYKKVSDYVKKAGQELKVGLQSYINHNTKKFEIVARQSVDRSVNQNAVKPAIFSNEYENVSEFAYDYDENGIVTAIFVYSDEQKNKISKYDIDAYEHWNRKSVANAFGRAEKAIKIQPITMTENRVVNEQTGASEDWTVLDEEKTALLGRQKSWPAYAYPAEFFDCQLLLSNDYEKIFYLGDIITLQNTEWGVTIDNYVTEITHLYDKNGTKITATLGEPYKTTFEIFTNRQEG